MILIKGSSRKLCHLLENACEKTKHLFRISFSNTTPSKYKIFQTKTRLGVCTKSTTRSCGDWLPHKSEHSTATERRYAEKTKCRLKRGGKERDEKFSTCKYDVRRSLCHTQGRTEEKYITPTGLFSHARDALHKVQLMLGTLKYRETRVCLLLID